MSQSSCPSSRPRSHWGLLLALLLLLLAVAPGTAGTAAPLRHVLAATGVSPTDPQPAPSGAGLRYFAETGHSLGGGFRGVWEAGHAATTLGLPLTDEFQEQYSDGSHVLVQYFERGVLEYNPQAGAGQQVARRNLGALLLAGQHFSPPRSADGQVFPATGFAVGGEFLRYWRDMEGAVAFGNPLSPAVAEDGRLVQYFERAKFELHDEFVGTDYNVALAPAGWAALRGAGYSLPLGALVQVEPPQVAEGHTMLVRVTVPTDSKVSGTLDDYALSFVRSAPGHLAGQTSEERHALAGIRAFHGVGTHRLTLTITDARGRSRTVSRMVQAVAWSYPTERIELSSEDSDLLDPDLVAAEQAVVNNLVAGRTARPLWTGRFQLPLRGTIEVTAPFGQRRAYNDGPVNTFHAGTDLRADTGTAIVAPAAGRVVLAKALDIRGNCIIIDHGLGVYTLYAHLSSFRVHKGDTVALGQVLGLVGSTGRSTGPHLHWELHVSGPAVDPFEWTRRNFGF